ncbi:hypothetical protein BQ8794_40137 [Mesorhizobium prunaredense]|uniref:Uncharacterized protein n=1 Tax=Mesorhizobium prunaredense TaxID=1631249 RepID=A0A1R3VCL1_9HYPH|nr:hypothetical protein BQ8794_40137 [Mesorhizobium prunaredense]
MAAKRPEGVGPTGLGPLSQIQEVGAPRETTPSDAFGDISPSRGRFASLLIVRKPSWFRDVRETLRLDLGGDV